jgi:hypothetical protein
VAARWRLSGAERVAHARTRPARKPPEGSSLTSWHWPCRLLDSCYALRLALRGLATVNPHVKEIGGRIEMTPQANERPAQADRLADFQFPAANRATALHGSTTTAHAPQFASTPRPARDEGPGRGRRRLRRARGAQQRSVWRQFEEAGPAMAASTFKGWRAIRHARTLQKL